MRSVRISKTVFPISKLPLLRNFNCSVNHQFYNHNITPRINSNSSSLRFTLNSFELTQYIRNGRKYSTIIDSEIHLPKSEMDSIFYTDYSTDKLIINLTHDHKSKHRIFKNHLLKLIQNVEQSKSATPQQAQLMITCCSNYLPNLSPDERTKLLNTMCTILKKYVTFNIGHYNALLKSYKDNKYSFVARTFIEGMSPVQPNALTYQLLLAAVCEVGDINQAAEIIANMKANNVTITDVTFNSLIEGHGRASNIPGFIDVLEMMKILNIQPTVGTHVSLMKAYLWNDKIDEFKKYLFKAKSSGESFSEVQAMELVKCLAHKKLDIYIKDVLELLPSDILMNLDISPYMQAICIQLVHENFPEAAYSIYKHFPSRNKVSEENDIIYCRQLLREYAKTSTPLEIIKKVALDLIKSKRNIHAFQILCKGALQYEKVELACEFIKCIKEQGLPLRCHYFWPLLVQESKNSGEKGVFDILSLMQSMTVIPDHETFVDYILPNVNLASIDVLMKKFNNVGITMSTSLSSIACMMLKSGKLKEASELCNKFPGKIACNLMILPLVQCYIHSHDIDSLLKILNVFSMRPTNPEKDWVGMFLVSLISTQKQKLNAKELFSILSKSNQLGIGISTSSIDMCIRHLETFKASQEDAIKLKDLLLTMSKSFEYECRSFQQIPHPKHMTINELEAHLVELESKHLNTRGVLRKLLQEYCRRGHIEEAKNIFKKCEVKNISFSAGMMAMVFDLYIKCNDLPQAEAYLSKLYKTYPNFVLDEFKVINYATLLVRNKKIKEAHTVLDEFAIKCPVKGGKGIETNCRHLLDAVCEIGSTKETERMAVFISRIGYCHMSNIILGPIIRSYLNHSDTDGAVEKFVYYATKQKKTPLKHELICHLLFHCDESLSLLDDSTVSNKYQKLLLRVVEADRKIHGVGSSQISLIVALAEMNLKKVLRKYVLDPTVSVNNNFLQQQCQRLGEESKLTALENIAECMEGIRSITIEDLYETILKAHNLNSDCSAAEELWTKMQEKGIQPTKKFIEIFSGLLKSHKRSIPADLFGHMDTKTSPLTSP